MLEKQSLTIEPCLPTEEHALLILKWRNDPETLAMFFHHEPKTWERFWNEYKNEYFNFEKAPPIFVTENGKRLAFLRFKSIQHPYALHGNSCDISINVNPAERGRGVGTDALKLANQYLAKAGMDYVVAEVRKENTGSFRAFKNSGYQVLDQRQKLIPDTGEVCDIYLLHSPIGSRKRGLFLDLDGTLADSLDALKSVYYEFLESTGKSGSEKEFNSLNGPSLLEVIRTLKATYALPESVDSLIEKYMNLVRKAYQSVPAKPGAEILLQTAVRNGWTCGVVTSNLETLTLEWLKSRNLDRFVSCVVGLESIQNGKPAPDPYLLGLQRANTTAPLSLAVEDTQTGYQSATSAGIKTFLVGAEGSLKSLQELTPLLGDDPHGT
ncbi:GNAT family N-acetyltransferase [bacterium]|nr:GNAT family N-acetyltransferase [bacterium]